MPYNLRPRKAELQPPVKVARIGANVRTGKDVKAGKEVRTGTEIKTGKVKTDNEVKLDKEVKTDREITLDKESKTVKKIKTDKEVKPDKEVKTDNEVKTDKKIKLDKEVKPDKEVKTVKDSEEGDSNTYLYCFGVDTCGELGLGQTCLLKKSPVRAKIEEKVKQVACGPFHFLTLSVSGQVYSSGSNDEGALGRETNEDDILGSTPTPVTIDGEVTKVSAGDSHGAALTKDNRVFVWGNFKDDHGSVGLAPSCNGQSTCKPFEIMPGTKFKDIASGSNHMLILDTDGLVYSFGVGDVGQLGRIKPESSDEDDRTFFLTPQQVDLRNVDPQRPFVCDAVFAGNSSSFATNTDKKKNRLAGWGLNYNTQLGFKGQKVQLTPKRCTFTCSTSMIDVACGQHHTLFLTKGGRVYAAGRHDYGMLGMGKMDRDVCPAKRVEGLEEIIADISAGLNTSFAVTKSGKLFSWGAGGLNLGLKNEDEDLMVPTEVTSLADKRVLSVSAGASFTSIIANVSER